jgi:hypothetical protein
MKEFSSALEKLGIECRLVQDSDYSRGFPNRSFNDWFFGNKAFKKLINEFSPDAIFVDKQSHFGAAAISAGIPLFILLRGHYWSELEYAKKTMYKTKKMRMILWLRDRIAKKCFRDATAILPICNYLEDVVKDYYPEQNTHVFFEGIDSSHWGNASEMKLKHPCVGLLQDANWWGKTKEMLTLKQVLEKMPETSFYWAGDGPYRQTITDELEEYENFHWLGRLDYPDKVRDFLNEIDVYALVSGMDLAPLTLKEAQLMQKPVVATNAGGIPEMMKDGETGFLVEEGDHDEWIKHLTNTINDEDLSKRLGKEGQRFVKETFSWERIAENFVKILNKYQ